MPIKMSTKLPIEPRNTTSYDRPRREMKIIDLDKLAECKDADFVLTFGGAEFVVQYRIENAGRFGHPFIDVVVTPDDQEIKIDLCDDDGRQIPYKVKKKQRVAQLLLGQRVPAQGRVE